MEKLTETERKILAVLQHGFPASPTPYADLAERMGVTTEVLLDTLRDWQSQGKLRRIGAIVNHFRVGMGGGAMVVWQVPLDRVEAVGRQLADFPEVSHAYQRPSKPGWPFTLYTMVHAADGQDPQAIVARMSAACGVTRYRLLITEKELKKVAPTYVVATRTGKEER
jgi:DNA-binding Lrp family transcriptional regulator